MQNWNKENWKKRINYKALYSLVIVLSLLFLAKSRSFILIFMTLGNFFLFETRYFYFSLKALFWVFSAAPWYALNCIYKCHLCNSYLVDIMSWTNKQLFSFYFTFFVHSFNHINFFLKMLIADVVATF